MLCANVKVSAEIYKKNNAKPPAGIRYTHPRGCVFLLVSNVSLQEKPLGSLSEGAGWAAKLHSLRELLPPSVRQRRTDTSLKEGGKLLTQAGVFVINSLQKASLRYAYLL